MLKKQYLIFSLLLATGILLQNQLFKERIHTNQIKKSALNSDFLKHYEFNINQLNKQEYTVASHLTISSKTIDENPSQRIEEIAKTKLGKTYQWGGNGPYAYDCSGFTKEVFELNGITIPRVSKDQAKVGIKISKKNLKKGDLIFFDDKHSSVVSHVGIYLGHGKFIHASKFHKQIVISPLREYRRFFKWGRRLT